MVFRRLALAIVTLALLGFPVAALYCVGDDPAARACCRQQANECNRPGEKDDCCRTVPGGGQAAAVAVAAQAERLGSLSQATLPVDAIGVAPIGAGRASVALGIRLHDLPQDLPPPPVSVLRI